MHICHLTQSVSTLGGGMSEVVRALAMAQMAEGNRVTVLSTRDAGGELAPWPEGSPGWLRSQRLPGMLQFPDLGRELAHRDPDLIHVHGLWTWFSIGAPRWASRRHRPTLVSPHGMLDGWALAQSKWKKRLAALAFERHHLSSATCLHALCRTEFESIRAYGLKNPVAIIPNGVDLPEIGDRRPEIGDQKKTLLFLGRLHLKKGLMNALRAWKQALHSTSNIQNSQFHEWQFVIAGWDQGGHEAELKRLCDELGLAYAETPASEFLKLPPDSCSPAPIVFTGPAFGEQKDALLRRASAFILPSFSEGLPMSVLEAWAYRLPVLMTDHCNLPEGFAAEAAIRIGTEVESITRGMLDLLRSPATSLQSLGNNGRNLVERHFTWRSIADDMHRCHGWMLSGGSAPEFVDSGF